MIIKKISGAVGVIIIEFLQRFIRITMPTFLKFRFTYMLTVNTVNYDPIHLKKV